MIMIDLFKRKANMFKSLFDKMQNKTNKKDIMVILDNGHGKETPGKRSPKFPDGSQFFEYEFNRDIVRRIINKLQKLNIRYFVLVPEERDISLTERANRANVVYNQNKNKCFLLSVHANAAGMGNKWMSARGWSVWTTKGKTKADDIATIFWKEMKTEFPDHLMRMDTSDGDVDWESNFTILYKTICPAILTENFFQDNQEDCKMLMTEEGREKIANAHVRAIQRVIDELY